MQSGVRRRKGRLTVKIRNYNRKQQHARQPNGKDAASRIVTGDSAILQDNNEYLAKTYLMNTDYEYPVWKDTSLVCGIDEAGRGPLAGPVVAAAVVFPRWFSPENSRLAAIDDSKKLSPALREELAPAIKEAALCWAVATVEHDSIDRMNIFQATMLAMNNAVTALPEPPELLLVDGNRFRPLLPVHYETIVKGDSKVFSIAAASIIAKTCRDSLMREYGRQYPQYGFERHFGYPTGEHIRAIARYGRSPIHRKSFKLKQLGEK
ncbi:MAG: ribonuclease HII [Chlorobium sp.]|nr:ribonuclease HII [Chlorobium sp.]MCF8382236.1 ribonuclease HII [Chlorobium sp.]